MSEFNYDRSLQSLIAEGKPSLSLFPDGSDEADGAMAYARWTLRDGSYWSRLVMANHLLRPPEFNTLCYRISYTLNERPLGTTGPEDS